MQRNRMFNVLRNTTRNKLRQYFTIKYNNCIIQFHMHNHFSHTHDSHRSFAQTLTQWTRTYDSLCISYSHTRTYLAEFREYSRGPVRARINSDPRNRTRTQAADTSTI